MSDPTEAQRRGIPVQALGLLDLPVLDLPVFDRNNLWIDGLVPKIAPATPRVCKKAQIMSGDVPAASQYSEKPKRRILVDGILQEI